MTRKTIAAFIIVLVLCGGNFAYAFDFWGINVSTQNYAGSPQLAFSNVAESGVDYGVGGYKYTKVDSTWLGPFPAASPGSSYAIHRKFDAMGIFFLPDIGVMRFAIFTGMPQTGTTAAEVGYGTRLFGPGDLKIDYAGKAYGVGLRLDDLLWAVDPGTTTAKYKIYKATGGTDSIYARDVGTMGDVELNPRWARVDNHNLASNDPARFAFFVSGSGTNSGNASVTVTNTGLSLGIADIFCYEVTLPYSAIGITTPGEYAFGASWRPDCGNDLVQLCSSRYLPVPEPAGLLSLLGGVLAAGGLARLRLRKS